MVCDFLDMGLILYLFTFFPYEKCHKCSKEIAYFDISSHTHLQEVNGVLKEFYYCSKNCLFTN